MITPIKKKSLIDLVYDRISSMVMDGSFAPGEIINRKDLAEKLGVSQTPVNESINRLVGEGVLERESGKGFFIKELSDKDLADYFAARAGIEGISLKLCIESHTPEEIEPLIHFFDGFKTPFTKETHKQYRHQDHLFHEAILDLCGSRVLKEFNNNYRFMLKCYLKGLVRSPEETLMEHKGIIEAIINKDAELAQFRIMQHHLKSRQAILDRLEQ